VSAEIAERLAKAPAMRWLVTGAAGFIGSHLVEALLRHGQQVVGLDNFSSGHQHNLDQIAHNLAPSCLANFSFMRGDVRDIDDCRRGCAGVDVVLHHAAFCSVPASIEDPLLTHASNAGGFLNVVLAAREAKVRRVVYASSSAVYGNQAGLPSSEDAVPAPLSPYAATKYVDEVYAQMAARCYQLDCVGLRYFNVFGRRQDPKGAYAAVIPAWIEGMIRSQPLHINGDGETSRDFCHVDDIVQANLLAATARDPEALNQVYNIASGRRTTLNELFALIRMQLQQRMPQVAECTPVRRDFRAGDVRHSQADISRAGRLLGFAPSGSIAAGLADTVEWFVEAFDAGRPAP
jgi:UDP-N-acetylglucosamine/UDP-N-acetylgalactosamine 4-epimerase